MALKKRKTARKRAARVVRKIDIWELTQPQALILEPVASLFLRAFMGVPLRVEPADVLMTLARELPNPRVAIFIGAEDAKLLGLTIMYAPADAMIAEPQVYHFYNGGSAKLRDALIEKLLTRVKEWGYDSFLGANGSGHSDKAWLRAFRKGGTVEEVGMVCRFTLTGESGD